MKNKENYVSDDFLTSHTDDNKEKVVKFTAGDVFHFLSVLTFFILANVVILSFAVSRPLPIIPVFLSLFITPSIIIIIAFGRTDSFTRNAVATCMLILAVSIAVVGMSLPGYLNYNNEIKANELVPLVEKSMIDNGNHLDASLRHIKNNLESIDQVIANGSSFVIPVEYISKTTYDDGEFIRRYPSVTEYFSGIESSLTAESLSGLSRLQESLSKQNKSLTIKESKIIQDSLTPFEEKLAREVLSFNNRQPLSNVRGDYYLLEIKKLIP